MKKENPFSAHSRQRQLETPDHVQDYVRVTSVSPFLIGLTILLLLGAFVVWGIFGTVTDRVSYNGLIFPHHGTDDVMLESGGLITKMLVYTGDSVTVGQVVARVKTLGKDSLVRSTISGTVLHTKQDRENFEPLEPLVSMVCEHKPDNSVHTMLVAYVKMETHHVLKKGMEAQVWPMGDDRDKIGYVKGVITDIDRYHAIHFGGNFNNIIVDISQTALTAAIDIAVVSAAKNVDRRSVVCISIGIAQGSAAIHIAHNVRIAGNGERHIAHHLSKSGKVLCRVEYMVRLINADGIAVVPSISGSCAFDASAIGAEGIVIVGFHPKSNRIHFDGGQRCRESCTIYIAVHGATVKGGGGWTVNRTETATAIEVIQDGTTRQR